MASQTGQESTYQLLLRAVGGYLDQERPCRFRLMEGIHDFALTLERGGQRKELQLIHFDRSTLAEQAEQLAQRRRVFETKYRESWALCPTGHQDFLRALGYELDDSRAQCVALDELEDALLVTYSYVDPTEGYGWHKYMAALSTAEMEEILKAAHDRKQRRGFLKALRR